MSSRRSIVGASMARAAACCSAMSRALRPQADHEVTITLNSNLSVLGKTSWRLSTAARRSIRPPSWRAAGKEPIAPENYIGTGPYKFNEWQPNRHVELVRFDDYSLARWCGGRICRCNGTAEFDSLRFIPVPDVGTRVSGLKAGDYDYAESIPGDLYRRFGCRSRVSPRS